MSRISIPNYLPFPYHHHQRHHHHHHVDYRYGPISILLTLSYLQSSPGNVHQPKTLWAKWFGRPPRVRTVLPPTVNRSVEAHTNGQVCPDQFVPLLDISFTIATDDNDPSHRATHVGGSDDFNVLFIGAGNIMFGIGPLQSNLNHPKFKIHRLRRRPLEPFLPLGTVGLC